MTEIITEALIEMHFHNELVKGNIGDAPCYIDILKDVWN